MADSDEDEPAASLAATSTTTLVVGRATGIVAPRTSGPSERRKLVCETCVPRGIMVVAVLSSPPQWSMGVTCDLGSYV